MPEHLLKGIRRPRLASPQPLQGRLDGHPHDGVTHYVRQAAFSPEPGQNLGKPGSRSPSTSSANRNLPDARRQIRPVTPKSG